MSTLSIRNAQILVRRPAEDARQYAYRVIKDCILQLLLPPNRKLNEVDLAQTLTISRTPVHDTFFKLSRENIVTIYPKRGAFVSQIDPVRIEHAVWTHTQLGTSMLHSIFIKNVDHSKLLALRHLLRQLDDALYQRDLSSAPRIITEFYHQLYVLAGDMDLIWASVQKVDVDLRRVIHMASSSQTVVDGMLYELSSLTDALFERDCDRACRILEDHFSRMLLLAEPMQPHYPGYFVSTPDR